MNKLEKNIIFALYILGTLFIAIAPVYLLPFSFLTTYLGTLATILLLVNLKMEYEITHGNSPMTIHPDLFNAGASIYNAGVSVYNDVKSFFSDDPSDYDKEEKEQPHYNCRGNIFYSALTLVSLFFGVYFLPIRAVCALAYITSLSYMAKMTQNERCLVEVYSHTEAILQKLSFDNSPVAGFNTYFCNTGIELLKGL